MVMAVTTIHSSGVNWGQALATGVTIVVGLLAIVTFFSRAMEKRRAKSEARLGEMIEKAVTGFGAAIGTRIDKVEVHLGDQDNRLERIERKQDKEG